MTENEELMLEQEVDNARRASKLKNRYLDQFFEDKQAQLHEYLADLPLGQNEALIVVHHQLKSLEALKQDIQTYVDTGKLASMTLDKHTH